jgi:ankyrin repeat protein
MSEPSDDENAIVFQGTLLHQAVSQGSFELVKALIPHFKDPNPEAEPGTPYECMTPLNLAAFEGNKEIYNFLIEKIGQENLEEIPHLVDHRLACGSGFENPKGSENSDDSKTGSGSSENSSD